MGESSDSVSVDAERIASGGKEHHVLTRHGPLSVSVYGDLEKPALVTYPDVALDHVSCFQGLFFCTEGVSLLLYNFCIYQINPPGHEVGICLRSQLAFESFSIRILQLGAAPISSCDPVLSGDQLADQVADVFDYFGLYSVICMGVTAGAYVLTLFSSKYRERVQALILVSPLCKAPSWKEWLSNKVMSNILYFYGMCGIIKEWLVQRYFSKEVRGNWQAPESETVLDGKQSANVWRFLQSINDRSDLTDALKKLQCRTLIFVGEHSPFHSDALYMAAKMDGKYSALVEVQACGSLVTEEQPLAMLITMEYFLASYGLHRPSQLNCSPRSPLSPSYISPELLSPESMGVKLKPIKTRISLEV
ncbi:hypothetical protein ZIOFF_004132 [Zingiber officinale]|uniref:Pollen-specific protein SF21 n=1 Tax=Zingiber officinale TaxID=94328 RepID=A0A8J5MB15_ZINOF|nr:hypothetical protein ZIOFF_004132 [Zingiber officinale]